jgi:hypothetical protein
LRELNQREQPENAGFDELNKHMADMSAFLRKKPTIAGYDVSLSEG